MLLLGEQGPRQAKRGWTNCATRHRLQLFSYACSTKPLDTFASFHAIVSLSVRTKVTGRLSRLKVTTSQHVTLSSCDPFFETFWDIHDIFWCFTLFDVVCCGVFHVHRIPYLFSLAHVALCLERMKLWMLHGCLGKVSTRFSLMAPAESYVGILKIRKSREWRLGDLQCRTMYNAVGPQNGSRQALSSPLATNKHHSRTRWTGQSMISIKLCLLLWLSTTCCALIDRICTTCNWAP